MLQKAAWFVVLSQSGGCCSDALVCSTEGFHRVLRVRESIGGVRKRYQESELRTVGRANIAGTDWKLNWSDGEFEHSLYIPHRRINQLAAGRLQRLISR